MLKIMQGDAYPLYIEVLDSDDNKLTPEQIDTLELMIGTIVKTYPAEISWDPDEQAFLCPLTQEDTFALCPGTQWVQARPKLVDQVVAGWQSLGEVTVLRSESKAIL